MAWSLLGRKAWAEGVETDNLTKVGYALLGVGAVAYLLIMFSGIFKALAPTPFGFVLLLGLLGVGVLFIKVLKDRLQNKEDDYYSSQIDK